jgi:hypothetical protein
MVMRIIGLSRAAFDMVLAAALLAGCGGSQSQVAPSGVMPTRLNSTQRQAHQMSSSSGDLLYIQTGQNIVIVSITAWQIVGSIAGNGNIGDVCSDPYTGDVFVPQNDTVLEYAHGGTTPIATLHAPKGYTALRGCSVDPTTQNLAMTSGLPYHGSPAIIVFPGEQDDPMIYRKKKLSTLGATAYDSVGNLYLDVYDGRGKFFIGEIKAGQNQFNLIRPRAGLVVGKMQWDGTYLVGQVPREQGLGSTVYQLHIVGNRATVVNAIRFAKAAPISGFWISGGTLFQGFGKVPHRKNEALGAWQYPSGGKPYKTLYGIVHGKNILIYDLTVSVAPSRE